MYKEVARYFPDEHFLYAVMKDGTLQKYDGENWCGIPTVEIRCPSCGKLLEPHICKETTPADERDE